MLRFLAGVASALLLMAMGAFLYRSSATAERAASPAMPALAAAASGGGDDVAVPEASEKTREQRRFGRYDKDKDGQVAREEYLASRRKAYAKLDVNGDGRLTFDEWAVKTTTKFASADADRSGGLTPAEFATTAVKRKARPQRSCPPQQAPNAAQAEDQEEEG